MDGNDQSVGCLDLFAFQIEGLPQFPKASLLNPAFPRYMCGHQNLSPISVGPDPRIEAG
jgi:hypothetical protein